MKFTVPAYRDITNTRVLILDRRNILPNDNTSATTSLATQCR